MEKKVLRVISVIPIIIGLILLMSSLSITGNVISDNIGKTVGSILGLVFIIGGITLFLTKIRRPARYTIKSIDDIFASAGSPNKGVFILDSSGAIDYKRQLKKVLEKYPGEVYIPDEIIRELGGKFKERYQNQINTVKASDYEKYTKSAREKLEATPKHQDYLQVTKFLREGPSKLAPRERTKLQRKVEKAMGYLRDEGKKLTKENLQEYIDKRWKVSDGDISLLSTALDAARHRKIANILAEDTHVRDAVADIKRKNKKLGKFLNYLDYREYGGVA